jgi:heme o synthase
MALSPKSYSLTSAATAAVPHPDGILSRRALFQEYLSLTKPRLSFLSVVSAILGYTAAAPRTLDGTFFGLLLGTALSAGGACALNQWMERESDALMQRTNGRALPAGRIEPTGALAFSLFLCGIGPMILWWVNGMLPALLAVATLGAYLLLYTPMKRVSPRATELGAIPGALPPLIGWTAAGGAFDFTGVFLFILLFAWQMPHFMAIAWMCREDYARGGFRMASVLDPSGRTCGDSALVWAVLLALTIPLTFAVGAASWLFLLGAFPVSLWYVRRSFAFRQASATNKNKPARRLLLASVLHLPVVMLMLTFDRYLLG